MKKRVTPSLLRAKNKRKRVLPTKPMYDPFLGENVYINKNGRTIVYRRGVWQAV